MLRKVMEKIENLRGAEVSIFGQKQVLSANVDNFTVDVLDVLRAMECYEVLDMWLYSEYDEELGEYVPTRAESGEEYLEFFHANGDLTEVEINNTYNWLAPISNHLNYRIYENEITGTYFVELMVHFYGDVRGNYSETILLEFNNIHEFYEAMCEANKYVEVECMGQEYSVEVNVLSDGYEVYDLEGSYVCTSYGYDEEEIVGVIAERVA